jgi:2-isopropylmalate synthase
MQHSLIYDWNQVAPAAQPPAHPIEFDDETLRDGLQSPSVTDPAVEAKVRILHLMDALGIDTADIGLPGAGPRAAADVERLAREIVDAGLRIRPNCAARTHRQDIQPIIDISERVGLPIEACTFIGSSPIRLYAEDWTLDHLLRLTEEAITFAVQHGLPVMYVTEDTTRTDPEAIRRLFTTAINCGAKRVCVCDTVGHATPDGVRALLAYVREVVAATGEEVKIDWHGHCDRGLAVINAITAAEAGAHRLHGAALAVGERVGNAQMDLLLVNLQLMGWIQRDLSRLKDYCEAVSEACRVPIPHNYPVVGRDAFRTATGVHAAAVIKAFKKHDPELADAVYSGVPARLFGLEQQIEIGYMSGKSNVIYWLEKRGITPSDELVERILQHAKDCSFVLSEEEVRALIAAGAQA